MRSVRSELLLVVVAIVAACGGSAPESTKYHQTWTKSYADTTCSDWQTVMVDHERFVMAGDMLLAAQRVKTPDAPIPPDWQITAMRYDIDDACTGSAGQSGLLKIPDLAAVAYATDDNLKRGAQP